jgi:predicted RNase H-like nuclease (RuvC/YqgF family)
MKFALSLALCTTLLGCAPFTHWVATLAPPEPPSVSRVLQYYHNAKALAPDELRELYTQEAARVKDTDDPERMLRVALLLTLQGTAFRDCGHAAMLLQDYTQQVDNDSDLRALAFLLLSTLTEAQRQVTRYQQTKHELDGVIREKLQLQHRYEWASKRLARIQNEYNKHEEHYQKVNEALRQEQETVENLRKQIEQLKIIEQMLNERKLKKTPAT